MSNLQIGTAGLALIKKKEGFRATVYKCAAGKWTIGYGTTGKLSDGTIINESLRITISESRATTDLVIYCNRKSAYINGLITSREMKQNEYDALMCLVYNLGSLAKCPNLRSALQANDKTKIYNEWSSICRANGKVLDGLLTRRKEELNLFFRGQSLPTGIITPTDTASTTNGSQSQGVNGDGYINGAGSTQGTSYADFFAKINKSTLSENSAPNSVNSTTQSTTETIAKNTSKPVQQIQENKSNTCG